MREIVNLFSDRDSRDELGIGQIRDVLSHTLFPGTSTLLTRARYMLLIPRALTAAAKPGRLHVGRIRTNATSSPPSKEVPRAGKFGQFYGCINYPKCRNTMKEAEAAGHNAAPV
ncbi:DUF6361 family protein [Salinibacterium sp. NG253]|uniref:DUF6361 family protein n=1 Tax=Salinibacterium sp. NG253 TaxID=2792039 RepID=UPI0035A92BE3